jgi:hypothetical protein
LARPKKSSTPTINQFSDRIEDTAKELSSIYNRNLLYGAGDNALIIEESTSATADCEYAFASLWKLITYVYPLLLNIMPHHRI